MPKVSLLFAGERQILHFPSCMSEKCLDAYTGNREGSDGRLLAGRDLPLTRRIAFAF